MSDPFGIDVVLPDDVEYSCPGVVGEYCYSDGTQSPVPFQWDDFFILLEDLDLTDAEMNDLILAEWWSSYFDSSDEAIPPTSVSERYTVDVNGVLRVAADVGLLANDQSELSAVAAMYRYPLHGDIEMSLDGGFIYTPDSGFVGVDSFE